MIELILVIVAAVIAGIVIGLLPGLPIWAGVFLLFPLLDHLPLWQIVIMWTGILIGSQFFGSVSALLLKIPGETSSLVYINDVRQLSLSDRLDLIRQTAWGSAIATAIGLIFVAVIFYTTSSLGVISFTQSWIRGLVYLLVIVLLIVNEQRRSVAAFLIALGIALADKTNFALPTWLLVANNITGHITVFSATLSLIILPQLLDFNSYVYNKVDDLITRVKEPLCWSAMIIGSVIGSLSGLLPGASATIASTAAYKLETRSTMERVIAAESANNSAVITSLLPFILFGIPITVDELIISNFFTLQLQELPTAFTLPVFENLRIPDIILLTGMVFGLVFWLLSQQFLPWYARFVQLLHTRLSLLYFGIIAVLIYIDIHTETVNLIQYIAFTVILSVIGIWLQRKKINPIPLLLALVLGDNIVWTFYHCVELYF